ncbi:MAG: selenoprotein B, partial [Dehalococcoidia bacterium]
MPPRALWVPFPLGRPFGTANDRDFQLDVLRSLLSLFNETTGPVLADYGRDAPDQLDDDVAWTCALPLPPLDEATTKREQLTQALQSEAGFLLPWFEEGLSKRGRTM